MRRCITATILLFAWIVNGAEWFHDNAATGLNNGTSWANAWSTNIGWSSVSAGDTVYISGGSSTKTYTNSISVPKSGTPASPITIRISQEASHNGKAYFPGMNIGTSTNIIVYGARSNSFVPPVSVYDIDEITNNIGLAFGRTNETIDTSSMFVSGAGGNGGKIQWCEVYQGTTNNLGNQHGIQFLNLTVHRDWLIEYCWIHHVQNDGVNVNSVTANPSDFDALKVRWCLFEYTGDDSIQSVRNGTTATHCMFRRHWWPLYNGHPDHVQFSGVSSSYLKVVNCIFLNKGNSHIISENYVEEGGTIGPMLIAGNLFYMEHDYDFITNQAYGLTINAWRPNADISVAEATGDGIRVLHNTIYFQRATAMQVGRANPDGATRSVWALTMTNSEASNNLGLDCGYTSASGVPFSFPPTAAPGSGTNGIFATTNTFVVRNNAFSGANTRIYYNGVTNANGEAIGLGNTSTRPSIVSTQIYDFRPTQFDSVIVDRGFSRADLTNTYPELMFDLRGNPRGVGAGWDIGAIELSAQDITNGLKMWITFEDAPADDDDHFDDWSGNTNHARHFGYHSFHSTSNRMPVRTNFVHPVTGRTNFAAHFVRYVDGWDEYDESGSYTGTTNNGSGLWSMSKASVMYWARYLAAPVGHPGYTNWNAQGNRRPLGAGYGYRGAWTMGLPSDGGPRSAFRVYTNDNANADAYAYFPDRINTGNAGFIGSSTNMNHYCITWDRGECVLYYNGQAISTNTFLDSSLGGGAQLTNLTVRGPAGGANGMIQIGGDTHNGNPWLRAPPDGALGDDGDGEFFETDPAKKQVPNHGWFGFGTGADFRIYTTNLTASHIATIYASSGGSAQEEEGGGDPPDETPYLPAKIHGIKMTR